MPYSSTEHHDKRLQRFSTALEKGTFTSVRRMLNGLYPAEIAHLLESLPPLERDLLWGLVDPVLGGDVLIHLNDELRDSIIRNMEHEELVAATEGLETDDLADFMQTLPDAVIKEVLHSLDEQNRHRLETVMSYGENTAGGLMNTDTITVRPDVTLDVVLRYLRLRGDLPDATDALFVVDRDDCYMGVLTLSALITRRQTMTVAEVMDATVEGIAAEVKANEVAALFEMRDLISAAVVDDAMRLLGRITIDDVVDVIRDEAEHSMMSLAGLSEEEDMFAPVVVSARHRGVWLGVNLVTAFAASAVIGLFHEVLDKIVALAILMPVVASMGGIAGSQTLTLVIRAMALGQVAKSNARQLLYKELAVGVLNGLLWAVVVGMVAVLWFDDYSIGFIIAVAIVLNLIFAAFAGATIPMLLQRFGVDPALGAGVLLTTVTDVVGFMAFLGLASFFLL